jgi:uncharacterized protein YcbX
LSTLPCTLQSLHLYPIKSSAGVDVAQALVVETGLEFDRTWMVVDEQWRFVTQRNHPRLQLVSTRLRQDDLVLRAPGMLALHLALNAAEQPCRVQVWDDEVPAYDMGALAAQWFSKFIGTGLRLVRFDPDARRLASPVWTGEIAAETTFPDGYPLLVAGAASLAELNRRLAARGADAVTLERFRPNLVIDGLEAHEEDHVDELQFDTDDGPVRLRLVKPCTRCAVPNVDPRTAEVGAEPNATLATYRADASMNGAITFGMNAIVLEGIDRTLTAGAVGTATLAF